MTKNPENRPIVWVIKEQVVRGPTGPVPMDYTAAYKYGDIEFLTQTDLPLTRGPSSLKEHWTLCVRRFIQQYKPDRDYIVLTGSPLSIFLIGAVIGAIGSNYKPRVLVWRRETNEYVPFESIELFKPETVPATRN